MAKKKIIHTVTFTFWTSDAKRSHRAVDQIVENMYVQLEGITDDYGVAYENPEVKHEISPTINIVLARMVTEISKRVCDSLISEDANELAYELSKLSAFKNQPDLADMFMEACGIVEERVRKALGVKNG